MRTRTYERMLAHSTHWHTHLSSHTKRDNNGDVWKERKYWMVWRCALNTFSLKAAQKASRGGKRWWDWIFSWRSLNCQSPELHVVTFSTVRNDWLKHQLLVFLTNSSFFRLQNGKKWRKIYQMLPEIMVTSSRCLSCLTRNVMMLESHPVIGKLLWTAEETFVPSLRFDRRPALFHLCSLSLSRYGNNIQGKGGQTRMITFQRQIESVGLHRALISRLADRAEWRCSCIRFHRRQRVSRQREARLQTDTAS